MRISLASALAIVLTAGGLAGQQAPSPPFRLEVNYVEVDALVTDQNDRFVDDLGRDDFHIFEDGKAQHVTAFSYVDLPIGRRAVPSPPEPDVDSDVAVNARLISGRLYLFVLDDVHTSPLRAPLVRAAARQFVERHLGADDLVAVVQTGGTTETTQDFTSSRARIARAIDSADESSDPRHSMRSSPIDPTAAQGQRHCCPIRRPCSAPKMRAPPS